jgi:hypothetical protein
MELTVNGQKNVDMAEVQRVPNSTILEHGSEALMQRQQTLLNPCHIYIRRLFANFEALKRHQVCRWLQSLQMIKVMQMDMGHVAVMMHVGMLL